MKYVRQSHCGIIVLLFTALSGCSAFDERPYYSEKSSEIVVPVQWQQAKKHINTEFSSQLLDLIEQPTVTALVEQTLRANYDLRATALRLKESRLLQLQAGISGRPVVDGKINATRSKQESISNQYSTSLELSWELDVWGKLADTSDAANANTLASELDYQSAQNSLAAQVVKAWLDIAYREHIIQAESLWIDNLMNSEVIIKAQVDDGIQEQADLDAAKAETARVKANLIARTHQQYMAKTNLNTLRGELSHAPIALPVTLPHIPTPPLQIPSQMMSSRPDLLAAYQRIIASDRNMDVAYKSLLPSFTLSGSLGGQGTSPSNLLTNSSVWSLLGGITSPLFDSGRLKSNADIAVLSAQRSYLNYQKALLNAVGEVEVALNNEQALLRQQTLLQESYEYSQSSMHNYQSRYLDGASGILALLAAKRAVFQVQIQLLEIQQARFTNRITLGLALGMGV